MRLGIIDLGTNTFNILIVEVQQGMPFKRLFTSQSPVMLGSEGLAAGYLSAKAFERAYGVLRDFRKQLDVFSCEKVVAYGTSAIRSARNASDFLDKVARELAICIEPISGDQEALYIFDGVRNAVSFRDENYLILDIGGGSNEFIIANRKKLLWKHSFPLGGARLLEKFKLHDPLWPNEIESIVHYLDSELGLLRQALATFPVTKLVGSSGAFDSFAEMIHFEKNNTPLSKEQITSIISHEDFTSFYRQIIKTSKAERMLMHGLEAFRVDTIVLAAIFTRLSLEISQCSEIIQSSFSLKEGIAAHWEKHFN